MDINWPGEKLLIKLCDTLKEGVGATFRPWQIKREEAARIESRRRERLSLEMVEREVALIRSGEKSLDAKYRLIPGPNAKINTEKMLYFSENRSDSPEKIVSQISHDHDMKIIQRGINLRKIALIAEEESDHLDSDEEISEEPVDPDWFARWRTYAEDVSREEMQRLWARLLVGEVRTPGTYSIHTVEFLSRMSRTDAELIAKLAQFSLGNHVFSGTRITMEASGINFENIIYLNDINILNGVTGIGGLNRKMQINDFGGQRYIIVPNNNIGLAAFADPETPSPVHMPVYSVSRVGQEILSLARIHGNLDYLREIKDFLSKIGFSKFQYGRWLATKKHIIDLVDL